jgi:hypothetical protein
MVATVTSDHIVATMTLDIIIAFDTVVAYVIALVALLCQRP